METKFLHNISKETTARPEEFVAIAGEVEKGKELIAALKLDTHTISQWRQGDKIEHYMAVVPKIGIDSNYETFYHSDSSQDEEYKSLTEALQRYNEMVLERAGSPEIAQQYLIHNIPSEVQEFAEGYEYTRGLGYGSKPESCDVLYAELTDEAENTYTLLLHRDGNFALAENVHKHERFKGFDLQGIPAPKFDMESLQELLDAYAERTKTEVLYGREDVAQRDEAIENGEGQDVEQGERLEPSKDLIEKLTGDRVSTVDINSTVADVRQAVNERETQDISKE